MTNNRELHVVDDGRRDVLRSAGALVIAGLTVSGVAAPTLAAPQTAERMSEAERNNGPLGAASSSALSATSTSTVAGRNISD